MKSHVLKTLLTWIAIAAVLVGVVMVLERTVLPGLVEDQIREALSHHGLPAASFELAQASFTQTTIVNLRPAPESEFRVERIELYYSPVTLLHHRVRAIVVSGAYLRIEVRDGALAAGALPGIGGRPTGEVVAVPFDRLELSESSVDVDVEGRALALRLAGSVEAAGGNAVTLSGLATVSGATASLTGTLGVPGGEAVLDLDVRALDAGLLRDLAATYAPLDSVGLDGSCDLDAHLIRREGVWRGKGVLTGDNVGGRVTFERPAVALTLRGLRLAVSGDAAEVEIEARTTASNALVELNGRFQPRARAGEGEFHVRDIEGTLLQEWAHAYRPDAPTRFDGSLSLDGTLSYTGHRLDVATTIDGDNLQAHVDAKSGPWVIERPALSANVGGELTGGRFDDLAGMIELTSVAVAAEHQDLSVDSLAATIPFRSGPEVTSGTFVLNGVHVHGIDVERLAGVLSVRGDSMRASLSGHVMPTLRVDAEVHYGFAPGARSGELEVHTSRFTLHGDEPLAHLIAGNFDAEIAGSFEVDARVVIADTLVEPRVAVTIDGASWKQPRSKVFVDGISGRVLMDNLQPPTTAGPQRIAADSLSVGSFHAADLSADVEVLADGIALAQPAEFKWAGGSVRADSLRIDRAASAASGDLTLERLSLQGVLDFLAYDGVTGQGTISGELPLRVNWAGSPQIAFGDGVIEARPPKGRLQLSKRTAMTILGLPRELDPATASREEMPKALTLKALQDMEYSKLSIRFENNERGDLYTRVQIQGHGPVGDPNNRVPIGGLDINVSNFDKLLNKIVLPGMQSKRSK